ncbi:MAG: hypothetical protein A2Y76_02775 [Planctomycetes bacterium RBG_13_60_9]|nr:MAG: hypothetical protein A2Y76_02775 [Planctomycetes bacterium RBG_13_60_9]
MAFDAHLMISDPGKYIEAFAEAGADNITFHVETTDDPEKMIERIRALGCTAGVTLNPETPVASVAEIAPLCDMVLVMTVRPGFGGQEFMHDAARKIVEVRRIVGPQVRIEVDGGIDPETTPIVVSYGADTLVAGNAIFGRPDRLAAIEAIRAACR